MSEAAKTLLDPLDSLPASERGEVWVAGLALAGKVCPGAVVSVDRALVTLARPD